MTRTLLSLVGILLAITAWSVAVCDQGDSSKPATPPIQESTANDLSAKPLEDQKQKPISSQNTNSEKPIDPRIHVEPLPPKAVTTQEMPQPLFERSKSSPLSTRPLTTGEQAILKKLEEPTSFECTEKPLSDFVDYIRHKHRISVMVDSGTIKDAGIDSNKPISVCIPNIPLQDALDLILNNLKLTWTIRSNTLLITTQETEESHLFTKCYDVADLRVEAPHRPYNTANLPTSFASQATDSDAYARVLDSLGAVAIQSGLKLPQDGSNADFDSFIDMITSTIRPTTWDAVGGQGCIAPFGHFVVISQTLRIHREIESLFAEIRAKRKIAGTVLVELHWLWLDAEQHKRLIGNTKSSVVGQTSLTINGKVLAELVNKVPGFHGQIACSNGQVVHLASGDRRSIITSVVPIINTTPQPVIERPNVGVVINLCPSVVPGDDVAILDVQSTITRWGKQPPPALVGASWPQSQAVKDLASEEVLPQKTTEQTDRSSSPCSQRIVAHQGGSASCPVDRPVMPAQQFATTVRVPLGKPVILGSMTFAPSGDAGLAEAAEDTTQLVLIATTSIVASETESKKP